jgi:hypothetical protein
LAPLAAARSWYGGSNAKATGWIKSSTATELSVTVSVSGFTIVSVIFLHVTFWRSGPWLIVMK